MKTARFIASHPVAIIVACGLLCLPAAYGFLTTTVNYDILTYLPQDLDSMKGEKVLDEEFQDASISILILKDMEAREILELEDGIRGLPGVATVLGVHDVLAPTIPMEILPESIRDRISSGDSSLILVKYTGNSSSQSTQEAIGRIRGMAGKRCFLSGMSAILKDTKDLVDRETPLYVTLAVAFSVLVLCLAQESLLVPFVFLVQIGVAILYNLGTNFLFGQISYITKALVAVLQLGVTMDFSIFLLGRYEEERARSPEDLRGAMAGALHSTFLTISGGALTEVAGFLALCAMQLTLGKDIGVVMAKGVLFGLLCTMTLLPSLLLLLDRPIHRLSHRSLMPSFRGTATLVTKRPWVFGLVFLILFVPAVFGRTRVRQYYNLVDSLPPDMDSVAATNMLKSDYGMTTTHFLLVRDTVTRHDLRDLVGKVESVDGVGSVLALDAFLGPLIPEEMLPDGLRGIFSKGGWKLVLVNSVYKAATDEEAAQVDRIASLVKEVDPEALVTGEGVLVNDLVRVAAEDFRRVDLVSIGAICLIIALVFVSLSVPVLMVAGIELAILLNLAFSFFIGQTIPFIATIVIGCIQLGVTIDYAILLVTRYREHLRGGSPKSDAMRRALQASGPSITVSALSLFAATFGVGLISKVSMLRSLCMMIARGALISMAVILFLMPATFLLCEKAVAATSLHWRKKES